MILYTYEEHNETALMNPHSILIIQTAFIGDVILTTPLIEVLANTYPEARIDFLTIPKSKELLESHPKIENLITFDKQGEDKGIMGLMRIGKQLQIQQYDLCITPHRSLRSAILSWMTRAKCRIGFDRTAWRKAFTHIVIYNPDIHETERNLSLLSVLEIWQEETIPVLYATEEDEGVVEALLPEQYVDNMTLFAVAPGSVWPTKRWPEDYYSKFCELLSNKNVGIVLIGGKEDEALCDNISINLKNSITLAGKLNLRQTYCLLKKCWGILTNDSAPLHLAMAAEINVFAVFGPTIPAFGFAPFGNKSTVFEDRDLQCRPCAIHGSKKCPIKTFDCMKTLKPDYVASEILKKIGVEV